MDPKAGAGPSTRHRGEATATIDLYRQLYRGSDKIPKLQCKPETDKERKHRLQTLRENAAIEFVTKAAKKRKGDWKFIVPEICSSQCFCLNRLIRQCKFHAAINFSFIFT